MDFPNTIRAGVSLVASQMFSPSYSLPCPTSMFDFTSTLSSFLYNQLYCQTCQTGYLLLSWQNSSHSELDKTHALRLSPIHPNSSHDHEPVKGCSWSSCRNKSCMGHLSASSLLSPAIYDLCSENVHRVEWALYTIFTIILKPLKSVHNIYFWSQTK